MLDDHQTVWAPRVTYNYEVDGKIYTDHRIGLSEISHSDRGTAQAVLDRYPPNGAVTVHYQPDHPSEAVLEAGDWSTGAMLLLCALLMVAIGLLFWRSLRRGFQRSRTAAESDSARLAARIALTDLGLDDDRVLSRDGPLRDPSQAATLADALLRCVHADPDGDPSEQVRIAEAQRYFEVLVAPELFGLFEAQRAEVSNG